MRTSERGVKTFTQIKRRDQLVACMIDAIAELGYPGASVAEVARRAGVSKGVVTYHFVVKDDLIRAVIADVIGSMAQCLETRLLAAEPEKFPEKFVAAYITAWVGYYRVHAREVLALTRIHSAFLEESGQPDPAFGMRAGEVAAVERVLKLGQARGSLGQFSAPVVAAVIKAALDDLLGRFVTDPDLDLEGYGAELVTLFERATRPTAPAAPSIST